MRAADLQFAAFLVLVRRRSFYRGAVLGFACGCAAVCLALFLGSLS